jgi:uncharacterized protein
MPNGDKSDTLHRTTLSRVVQIVRDANAEYFQVLCFVVLGALFTAARQTLVPRADVTALGSQRAGSVLVLMPIATIRSICSEADAFVVGPSPAPSASAPSWPS